MMNWLYGAEHYSRGHHSIVFQHLKESEGSSPNSQGLPTCPYPEPDQSNPHHPNHYIWRMHVNSNPVFLTLRVLWDLRFSQKWLWRAETYKINRHTVRQTIQSWVPPILKTKTAEAGTFLPEHMVSRHRICVLRLLYLRWFHITLQGSMECI
jgi:hypothetical protein